VLVVAFTGLAALLLIRSRTSHSAFALPLDFPVPNAQSLIKVQSTQAQTLRDINLIIWGEASMIDRRMLDLVNALLSDVCSGSNAVWWQSGRLWWRFQANFANHHTRQHRANHCGHLLNAMFYRRMDEE